MSLREVCHCGHDITSHYLDNGVQPPERVSCLARGCDCRSYQNENEPKLQFARLTFPKINGVPKRVRPHFDSKCRCSACASYDASLYK